MTTDSRGRTYWNVEHPEARLRLVVPVRTEDEARALAWRRWYGREPTTEFADRLRAAFSVGSRPVGGSSQGLFVELP